MRMARVLGDEHVVGHRTGQRGVASGDRGAKAGGKADSASRWLRLPVHERLLPAELEDPGHRVLDEPHRLLVLTWIIEENGVEALTSDLASDQLKLPIASIWDHELLKDRPLEGWSPEQTGTS